MNILLGVSLAPIGILAGIYLATSIHDYRVADLSATQYVAMHQMRDKTFRAIMPALSLTTFGLASASAAWALAPGVPSFLGAAACLLLMIDIILATTWQIPLNRQIQSWTESATPLDWHQVRDRWALHHNMRTTLGSASYVLFLAAVLTRS